MFIYDILIPVAMFICSLDGYNAINHFRLWLQCRRALKGASA